MAARSPSLSLSVGVVSLLAAGSPARADEPPPQIDFDPRPSYLPDDVLTLTFDDGPDSANTERVLDILAARGKKATFFINTENWGSVASSSHLQDVVRRIVDEGHELANHTVHHRVLSSLAPSEIEAEIDGVQAVVDDLLGAAAPRLTLLRAPYGDPYVSMMDDPLVAPIVATRAVHIGWAIDTEDWACDDGACVVTAFGNAVATPGVGDHGVVLLHSVHAQTADALPEILDYIEDNGFTLWTTEQVVCARFGSSSGDLVEGTQGGCEGQVTPQPDAGPLVDAGVDDRGPDAGVDGSGGISGSGCHVVGPGGGASLLAVLAALVAPLISGGARRPPRRRLRRRGPGQEALDVGPDVAAAELGPLGGARRSASKTRSTRPSASRRSAVLDRRVAEPSPRVGPTGDRDADRRAGLAVAGGR